MVISNGGLGRVLDNHGSWITMVLDWPGWRLGSFLGALGGPLGTPTPWDPLGTPWDPLGTPLGPPWPPWEPLMTPLGPLGNPLGRPWDPLGTAWDPVGASPHGDPEKSRNLHVRRRWRPSFVRTQLGFSSVWKPVSIREREARYISVTSRKVGTTPASPENNNRFAHHGIPTTS